MEGLHICHVDHDLEIHISGVSLHNYSASHEQRNIPNRVTGVEVGASGQKGLSKVAGLCLSP